MDKSSLPIRDQLSFERTNLANERTLLAYIRTFLGVIAAGAALLKLFEVTWAQTAGIVLLVLGPLLLVFGLWRFFRIKAMLKHYPPDPDDEE